jgi:hypothetical protein
MPQFLVTILRPADYDASTMEDEAMRAEISALNDEMVRAGARVFVGGLQPPSKARALRRDRQNGQLQLTDGPYAETREHIGGLWVLEAADLEAALDWGRKAAKACRAPVEVWPFY